MVASETLSHDNLKQLLSRNGTKIKCFPKPKSAVQTAVFSSTCPRMDNPVKRFVRRVFGLKALQAGKDFKVPIPNRTDKPGKVGQDRLLNALAAYNITVKSPPYPTLSPSGRGLVRGAKQPTIVIDCGTAITLDVVSKDGVFLGGVIAPGMSIMAKALHQNCVLLPMVNPHKPSASIGKDTESAIASGIYFGTVGLVNQIVKELTKTVKTKPNIIITGGDAQLLKPHLVFKSRYEPNLTLQGLYITGKQLNKNNS